MNFRRLFRPRAATMAPMEMMAEKIAGTSDTEIDCDAAFEVMHQYAELLAAGRDTKAILPEVYRHLEMCPDCREELEALLRAMKA